MVCSCSINISINLLISFVFNGHNCLFFDLVLCENRLIQGSILIVSRIQIWWWGHRLDFHLDLLHRILPSRASLLLLILLRAVCYLASAILLCSLTMLVLLATFWVNFQCCTFLSQYLLGLHQYWDKATTLTFWIYVIYSILHELFLSTISFKSVKNYHTIALSMYCCSFETF